MKKSSDGATEGLLSHDVDHPSAKKRKSYRCRVITLITLIVVLVVVVVAVEVYQHRSSNSDSTNPTDNSLVGNIKVNDIMNILSDFNLIANNNKNSRSVTRGYNQSAEYVLNKLQTTGNFNIDLDYFTLPVSEELRNPILERTGDTKIDYIYGTDYLGMTYSGNGSVVANLTSPGGNLLGCNSSDYAFFPPGNIALVMRGVCGFWDKAMIAQQLGALGIIIYNDQNRSLVFSGSVLPPASDPNAFVSIPVVGASYEVGAELYSLIQDPQLLTLVNLEAFTSAYIATTYNIIADSKSGNPAETVVIGSHLDGVDQGPGINDNGSGSATNLALALLFARLQIKPVNRVRFCWWGAEELGLIGSQRYLQKINSTGEIANIALNLNFDMVGSLNYVRGIYNGSTDPTPGSLEITKVFVEYFESVNLTYIGTYLGGGSDHYSFMPYGIPVGGTSTGAGGVKSERERDLFGGEANAPYDSCYHQACDTIQNIDPLVLDHMAHGAAYTLEKLFSMDKLHDFLWPRNSKKLQGQSTVTSASSTSSLFQGEEGSMHIKGVEMNQWGRSLRA